jgi:hypothetical protein
MKELISTFCSLVVRQAPGVLDGNFLTFDISKDISAVNRLVSSSRQLETIWIPRFSAFLPSPALVFAVVFASLSLSFVAVHALPSVDPDLSTPDPRRHPHPNINILVFALCLSLSSKFE